MSIIDPNDSLIFIDINYNFSSQISINEPLRYSALCTKEWNEINTVVEKLTAGVVLFFDEMLVHFSYFQYLVNKDNCFNI